MSDTAGTAAGVRTYRNARHRRAVRLYNAAIAVAAAGCLAFAATSWWRTGGFHPLAALLAIAAIVATGFAPLTTYDNPRYGGAYLDSAVLIAMAVLIPPGEVMVVYAIGQACSHLTLRTRPAHVLLNLSWTTVGSALALGVIDLLRGAPGSAKEAAVVVVAAAVYSATTGLGLMAYDRIAHNTPLRHIWASGLPQLVLAEATVIDSLGYIAAVLARRTPWALLLLTGPVVLLWWTSRGLKRLQVDRVRMAELARAGDEASAAADRAGVLGVLLDRAPHMLTCDSVELRDAPPAGDDLGADLELPDAPRWIVAHRGLRKEPYNEQDSQALHALVRLVQSTVANRDLLADVSHRALHDPLTGLANRTLFDEVLAAEVRRCRRSQDHVTVIYLDLNGFKPVNDELGHDAGNAVLVETARRLLETARSSDTVARIGGDEFCVVAPGVGRSEDALRLAEKICHALARPHEIAGAVATVTASAGVAIGPRVSDDVETLVRRADLAMYRAKETRGGPVLAP